MSDLKEKSYVAIKVSVAGGGKDASNRELEVMKQLGLVSRKNPHIVHMMDHFTLDGPNGDHKCIVLELLGPNVPEIIDACFSDGRLPGKIAKSIARQALLGLDALHQQKVGHGETLHTPLPVRPPEAIFKDQLDYHVDLWTMGCMLFELFVGQPPFDSFLITPEILVSQMLEMTSDELPKRWQAPWETMSQNITIDTSGPNLQEWLEEMYFDGERKEDLTREDIIKLGKIIGKLLRFEPYSRASAREILDDPWFRE
ncbi:hypothetical protein Plec18167_003547 [Paecilomyces lecythidis]|uniref:Protein kinase domain-containing protein n=1 Tax=Paecilomyces lecythidis TaxID=3004212 RepID=A0ABR3XZE0_9EURO